MMRLKSDYFRVTYMECASQRCMYLSRCAQFVVIGKIDSVDPLKMITVPKYWYSCTMTFALGTTSVTRISPIKKVDEKWPVSSAAFQLLILGNNNHDTPQLFNVQAPSKGIGMTFNQNHET